ncbi:hypothetical protein AB0B28_15995 [Glycomyces sp. NPDC046736]|uniref:hypothetical protein n=1 Tax=Glycomyces sp. NPDC046736 TaxID=3155615 RepID=UPI0034088393
MNEQAAIDRVREYAREKYPDYPTADLVAERFEIGWTIFPRPASGDIAPEDISTIRIGRTIFLIGDSGTIMEASSSLPPGQPEAEFVRQYGR